MLRDSCILMRNPHPVYILVLWCIYDMADRGKETYTWSSWFGQLNNEVSHVSNVNLSEGRGGWSFKQRLHDWKVHFTKELSMMSGK